VPKLGLTTRFSSLRAFRYPAYVRIWTGAFVSNLGTWIQTISIGVYVTEQTGQAGWTGSIAAMTYLPAVFLGPLGGALADRVERRRLIAPLVVVQALAAATLAVLALTHHLPIPAIAALVFLNGCASALAGPAFNALLLEIVEPQDLLSAVSLSSGQFNLARTLGPMLAAAALTSGGITLAFVANTLSFFAVFLAVLSAPAGTPKRTAHVESLWRGIVGGLKVARADPGIRLALPLVMAQSVLVAPFIGLMPAFAIKSFGRGAAAASVLAMSQGLGALVAAFTANAVAQRWGVKSLLKRSLLAVSPVAAAYWLAPTYPLAFALLALLGGVYLWTLTALSTTCMGRVSRDLQARMSSLYSVTLSGGYSVGLMAQGWLADRLGMRLVPVVAAAIAFALTLALAYRRSFDALDAPATAR
jgi:MFS family permease